MTVVWKYSFPVSDLQGQVIHLPAGARVLHVGSQVPNVITMWAEVDPQRDPEARLFHVVGTGHPVPAVGTFVGTVMDDPFVWHVYEVA